MTVLNISLKEPEYYHRQYDNDVKHLKSESSAFQKAQRVGLIALPFHSLHKPLGSVISLTMNSTRSFSCLSQSKDAFLKGDLKEISITMIQSTLAVVSTATVIFGNVYGMMLTSANDIIMNLHEMTQLLYKGQHEQVLEKFLQLCNNTLYLTMLIHGSLEIIVLSFIAQILIEAFKSQDLLRKFKTSGDVLDMLEGLAHISMSAIRGYQMKPQLKMLKCKWEKENEIKRRYEIKKAEQQNSQLAESKSTAPLKPLKTESLSQANLQVNDQHLDDKNREFLEKVELLLKKDPSTLNLHAQFVGDEQLILLAGILPSLNIETLDLSNNSFEYSGMLALVKALPSTQIKNLDISSTYVCAFEKLAEILPQTQIEKLNLYDTGLRDREMESLIGILPETKINDLNLGCNDINDYVFTLLNMFLPETKIQTLDLSNNDICMKDDEAIISFQYAITNSKLERLNLSDNSIKNRGAFALGEALPFSQIKELNLSCCGIKTQGIQGLSEGLAHSQIKALDLSTNHLGSKGLVALSQALVSSNIERLDLAFDQEKFDVKSLELFKDAVINSKLSNFSFGFNEISIEGAKILAEILEKGSLETLNLRCDRSLGPQGAIYIAAALKRSTLKYLYFDSNNIQDEGFIALANVIPFTKLEKIDLRNNGITEECFEMYRHKFLQREIIIR